MEPNAFAREQKTMAPMNRLFEETSRAQRVLARVRNKQLDLALRGRIEDSARYACRAWKVRRQLEQISMCTCFAA